MKDLKYYWAAPIYLVVDFEGIPSIQEPNKHESFAWFSINNLPNDCTKSVLAAKEAFKALYVASVAGFDQLRGWFVTRTATRERAFTLGTTVQRASWAIVGYMALSDADASGLAFDGLVVAIRAAWRANPTLGGLVAAVASDEEDGIQVDELATVLFCGVLCHQARLSLKTEFEI